jgi:methionyl-tRNA formyltransferase
MRLTAGLDSGPVCLRGEEPISSRDTYGTLAERLQELGGALLLRALREAPEYEEQDERGVTYAEKIVAADRLLDPARSAAELERTVRALHPHIGARLALEGGELIGVRRVAVAEPAPGDALEPGALRAEGERLLLGCGAGVLELLEVQPAGGRPMDAGSYLRGHGLGRR